jgi:hypothetical protein
MSEHGVKFVKPVLPKWEWKPAECNQLITNNPSYPGEGSRHGRRKSLVLLRAAMKLEAKRAAQRKARDEK